MAGLIIKATQDQVTTENKDNFTRARGRLQMILREMIEAGSFLYIFLKNSKFVKIDRTKKLRFVCLFVRNLNQRRALGGKSLKK